VYPQARSIPVEQLEQVAATTAIQHTDSAR